MKSFLNSTASLLVCISLSVPTVVTAQQESVADCTGKKKDREFPCLTEFGLVAEDQKQFKTIRQAAKKGNLEELRAQMTAAQPEAQTDTAAPSQQAAEQVEDQATAEVEAAAAAEAEELAAAEAEALAEAEAQAAAEAVAAAEAKALAAAEAEALAEAEAQAAAEAEALAAAERDAQAQAEEEARLAAAAAAEKQAEADAAEQQQAAAEALSKQERKDAKKAERKAAKKAERQAAKAAAAAAAADTAELAEDVQVETEEVTEENSRSSDEEFETSASGTPVQNAQRSAKKDDDDGLSKFEKALLLGLGAVIVGKVLDNGDEVVSKSGDRVVVERDGELRVLKNDNTLLRQPGSNVRTETFNDGSTRNIVTREDGSQIVTIQAPDGRVLSRTRITPDGEAIVIFDDTQPEPEIAVNPLPPIEFIGDGNANANAEEDALTRALQAELGGQQEALGYSLRQVRDISQVRKLAPEIELTNIRFQSGSAAIRPEQARSLAKIGSTIVDIVQADPRSVVLIEGHTDAVGGAAYNLALSDRRAESVALALTEYFNVPPENLIVQGYGEASLKVPTLTAEPANRRAVVRNITPLLR